MNRHLKLIFFIVPCALFLSACAVQENNRALETQEVRAKSIPYTGEKKSIVLGHFSNNSTYMRGLFNEGVDRLGDQARTVLKTHLQQTNRFSVMDRSNLENLAREAQFNNQQQKIEGARYVITGGVTEFGRRDSGDKQLFGIIGKGKTQMAYAKVMLSVVDTLTSKTVYSSSGAGEYSLTARQVAGFGSTSGYDATLNGKVLDLAIREAVDNLVVGLDQKEWTIE